MAETVDNALDVDCFRLRLIVGAPEGSTENVIIAANKRWQVLEYGEEMIVPPFTCISYVWGDDTERQRNPFVGPDHISTHTIPSLESAMVHFPDSAFWVDAFCIPAAGKTATVIQKKERWATLESMGYIYKHAAQVVVALPEQTHSAMELMVQNSAGGNTTDLEERYSARDYAILEGDRWIQSVWTYQEVMGSAKVYFVSEDSSKRPLPALYTFNAIGYYQSHLLRGKQGLAKILAANEYPNLDDFVNLVGDWFMDAESYALKVMANMDKRKVPKKKNYWYARISAVTAKRQGRPTDASGLELANRFMDCCDENGDFSYIFSSSRRQDNRAQGSSQSSFPKRKRWRPDPVEPDGTIKLPAIVPSHNSGGKQPGIVNPVNNSLCLEKMAVYTVAPDTTLSREAKRWFASWNERLGHLRDIGGIDNPADFDVRKVASRVFQYLQLLGFTGENSYIVVEDGIFYPQTCTPKCEKIEIGISVVITYVFGAPGLLSYTDDEGCRYVPGIFVGEVSRERSQSGTMILL
ncbi:hypothetical protein ABW19_dt0201653 [Dactylella cylindrospora]|nr:hypothetical protein ABW19_dt0201653 [Dactylella cylindrospora]